VSVPMILSDLKRWNGEGFVHTESATRRPKERSHKTTKLLGPTYPTAFNLKRSNSTW